MAESNGRIISIKGLVCEVRLSGERPAPKELVTLVDNPNVFLEVASYPSPYIARCINLTGSSEVKRGAKVVSAHGTLAIPETSDLLGRALNAFAEPIDGGPMLQNVRKVHAPQADAEAEMGSGGVQGR